MAAHDTGDDITIGRDFPTMAEDAMDRERFAVGVAHRRCGKTVACINDMIRRAATSSCGASWVYLYDCAAWRCANLVEVQLEPKAAAT